MESTPNESPKLNNYYKVLEENSWVPEEPDVESMIKRWNSDPHANLVKNEDKIRIKIQKKKRSSGWGETKAHDPPNIEFILKSFAKENPLDIEEKLIMDHNNEQQLYASFNAWNIEEPPTKKSKGKVSWADLCDSDNEKCTTEVK